MFDLIKYPILSSKSTKLLEINKYSFIVDSSLSKTMIKILFKEVFGFTVISVNTSIPSRKRKFRNKFEGVTSIKKKVIITLGSNDSFPIFPKI
jgi:large subunit ribosomal protein L23